MKLINRLWLLVLFLIFLGGLAVSNIYATHYELELEWGSEGSFTGGFLDPQMIALDNANDVYVLDKDKNAVIKFSSTGTFITEWGEYGSSNGQFDYPFDIAADNQGYVYVVDQNNNRIQKFSSTGAFITAWGSYGSGPGQFNSPTGVAVDYIGDVYVIDGLNNRVQKFDFDGNYIKEWSVQQPRNITIDTTGLYIENFFPVRITKYDLNGTAPLWNVDVSYNSGLAVDKHGGVLAAPSINDGINRYDTDTGNYLGSLPGDISSVDVFDLDVDTENSIYLIAYTGLGTFKIRKYSGPLYSISGTIKDETGTAINTATVTLTGTSSTGAVNLVTYPQIDGTYTFEVLQGTYQVSANLENRVFDPMIRSYENITFDMLNQDFQLYESYEITGYIEDESGNRINRSTITVFGHSSTGAVSMDYNPTANGEYEFTVIPGTYTISPRHDETVFTPLGFSTNSITGDMILNFTVSITTHKISGYIEDTLGARVHGSTLTLTGTSTTGPVSLTYSPGIDGEYEFSVIKGSYMIVPNDYATFDPTYISFSEVTGDQTNQNFTATLFDTFTVTGYIEDIHADRVSGATLTLSGESSTGPVTMRHLSTSNGEYEFMIIHGTYSVTPSHVDATFDPVNVSTQGLVGNISQNFTAEFATHNITGYIEDSQGNKINGPLITLTGDSPVGAVNLTDIPTSNGEYEFLSLINGSYTITASHYNYASFEPVSVTTTSLSEDMVSNFTILFETYTITGYIEDLAGNRINHSTLTLTGTSSTGSVSMKYSPVDNGEYEFQVIYGTYTITPTHDEATFSPTSFSTASIMGNIVENFTVEIATYTLKGFIKDNNFVPVAGSTVTFIGISSTGPVTLTYSPGTDGAYEFTFIKGSYELTPTHIDGTFDPVSIIYTNLDNSLDEQDFSVQFTNYKISGTIRDVGGVAIEDTTVTLQGISSTGPVSYTYYTESTGTFEFDVIRGSYTLEAVKQDGTMSPESIIYADLDSDESNQDFTVTFTTYTISGKIKDLGGQGVIDSTVTLTGISSTGAVNLSYVTSSYDGTYEFQVIRGSYTITGEKEDGTFSPLYISTSDLGMDLADQDFEVDFVTYTISGNIVDANDANVEGATVTLSGISATGAVNLTYLTASNGEYDFQVRRGSYTVIAYQDGTSSPTYKSYLNIDSDESNQDFIIDFTTYVVSGYIKYLDGAGVEGTTVTLTGISATGSVNLTYLTLSGGAYEFELIKGSYTIAPENQDLVSSSPSYISYSEITSDKTDEDFILTLNSYTVSGTVVNAWGSGMLGATVTVSGISATGTVNLSYVTEVSGTYEFELLRGSYTTSVLYLNSEFDPYYRTYTELDSNQTDQDYEVRLGTYTILGVLEDSNGNKLNRSTVILEGNNASGSVYSKYFTETNGEYSFEVYNGTYTITPIHDDTVFTPVSVATDSIKADMLANFTGVITSYTLSGYIKDDANHRIEGTTLTLSGTSSTGAVSMICYSDTNGEYEFEVMRGDYDLTPQHLEASFFPLSRTYSNLSTNLNFQNFTAEFIEYTISGYVKDDNGLGISDTTMSLTGVSSTGTVSLKTITTTDGFYEFSELFRGSYTITAVKLDGTFTPLYISTGDLSSSATNQDFEVKFATYTINGTIEDANGLKIANTLITLTGTSSTGAVSLSYSTQESGTYEFELIRGSYTIVPSHFEAEFSPGYKTYTELGGNETVDFTVIFSTYRISGLIKDDKGAGIEGATVAVTGISSTGTVNISYLTSSNGLYDFELILGTYTVTVTKQDGTITPGPQTYYNIGTDYSEDYTITFVTYTISGQIKDVIDGGGLADTTVTLTGISPTGSVNLTYLTASDGLYSFEVIRGSYTVVPLRQYAYIDPGYISYTSSDLDSDKLDQDFNVDFPTYVITGMVKNDQGSGVDKTILTLTGISATGPVSMTYLTSQDGLYEFREIIRGSYTIVGTKEDGTFSPGYKSYSELTSDQTSEDFEVSFITYTISGVLKYINDAAIIGATVTLTGISPTGSVNLTYITTGSGLYEFDVIRGSYTINVIEEDTISIDPSPKTYTDLGSDQLNEDYTLTLTTYKIEGIVEDSNGAKIENTSITVSGTSSTGAVNITYITGSDGSYEFDFIRGDYEITPLKPDGVFTPNDRSYSNLSTDELNQDFIATFGTRYWIRGTIKDPNGTGISRTTVSLSGISSTGTVNFTYVTKSDGVYEFELMRGSYVVTPIHIDSTPDISYRNYDDLNSDEINQDFTLILATYTIAGVIHDSNGQGITNTTLTLTGRSSTGTVNLIYFTDSTGLYEFEVIRGSYAIIPTHVDASFDPEYMIYPDISASQTSDDYTIEMSSYLIRGLIKDSNHNIVNGSTLTLTGISSTGPVNLTYFITSSGLYEFELVRGSYTITASHAGGIFEPSYRTYVGVSNTQDYQNYIVSFDTYVISGNIKDNNNVDIEGANVVLSGVSVTGSVSITALTTASGAYEFIDIIKGTYTLVASYDEGVINPTAITQYDLNTSQLNQDYVVTFPTYSITGSVNNNHDTGIAGTTMTLQGTTLIGVDVTTTCITDANGDYIINDLIKGSYELSPSHQENTFDPLKIVYTDFSSSESSQDFTGNFTTYTVIGYLKDTLGNGLLGMSVTLIGVSSTGTVSFSYVTTSSGAYEFNVIRGSYTIIPDAQDYKFIPSYITYSLVDDDIIAPDLEGSLMTYAIEGYLKTKADIAISGGTVTLSGDMDKTYITGDDGYYILTGLTRGDYTLAPEHSGYVFDPLSRDYSVLTTTMSNQNFDADVTTYTIRGYALETEVNTAIAGATVSFSIAGSSDVARYITDENGYYEFSGLGGLLDYPTVTPLYSVDIVHKDYNFSPSSQDYDSFYEDQDDQNFIGTGAILTLDVTDLDFGELKLGENRTLSFRITNTGGGTLEGTITGDREWITLGATSFSSNDVEVSVNIDRNKFEKDGYYTGIITVHTNGGTGTISVLIMATCVLTKPNPYDPRHDGLLKFYGSGIAANDTTINIFTISGEHVKTLREENGLLEIGWDGKNEDGDEVTSGIYLYTSKSPKERWTGKFTVLKN